MFGEPIDSGGQEVFVINLINNIDMTDLTVDVFTPYECLNDNYRRIIEAKGGQVFEGKVEFSPGSSRNNIIPPLNMVLNRNSYDAIHIHSGSTSVLALGAKIAKKRHIRKIIVHSHCAAEKETFRHWVVKKYFTPGLLMNPTDYFACSKVAAEWKFPNSVLKKTKLIKNGVDLDLFAPNQTLRESIRKKIGVSDDEFLIGHVGRFSYQKNHEQLINIFKEFKAESENDTKLLLIGSGELENEIKKLVERENLQNSVIFTGSISNVHEYLQAMDAFVLPSRFEGLPFVGVEAQAVGIPLLVSENVSEELKLTEGIKYLSLEKNQVWIEELKKIRIGERFYNHKDLRKAGYDVKYTAEEVRRYYFA